MQYLGEIAAISAALAWAVATWVYSQFSHKFSAMQMNIVKGVVASTMMLFVLPTLPLPTLVLSPSHFWILAISGIIGIAIGDSAYFSALKRIGANKTLLLESLAPPLSGILALLVLGSALSSQSWIGVVVTTIAVTYVVFQPNDNSQPNSLSGIGFGLLASICQATGVVISHYALVAGDVPPLLGALIRLSIGVLVVFAVVVFIEKRPIASMWSKLKQLKSKDRRWLVLAIIVGTFLALWLQQVALKNANPAIAQTLIATSPLFILVIYAWNGEPITKKNVIGTIGALFGISLFFL
ncbi:DMT family transporter [Vibrio algarum]|uniref:DMT family transporter n=1 Tax=Vibrio algarum TaxID=3020714 RepID=A0ABT4YVN0_9VIBR|nr:DMT family transporter [Vibrio sp. KJ40-1]MDB1125637.1 DMT family transporter [Vibrio sp. KJ40-1]